ncbi:hypothetical protein D3C73_1247230 [compost metagenome]
MPARRYGNFCSIRSDGDQRLRLIGHSAGNVHPFLDAVDEGIAPQIYAKQHNVRIPVQQLSIDRSPCTWRVPPVITGGEGFSLPAKGGYGMGRMPGADHARTPPEQLR